MSSLSITARIFLLCLLVILRFNTLTAQCNISNTGTAPALGSLCSTQSFQGGAGECKTLTISSPQWVSFCLNTNGNSQVHPNACVNNNLTYNGTAVYLTSDATVGFYRQSTAWNGTSAVLTYSAVSGPTQLSIAAGGSVNGVCSNTPITFTATATNAGSNPVYQWQVNGVNAGTNSPTFTNSNWGLQDQVICKVTGSCGCVSGSSISLSSNTIIVSSDNPYTNSWQKKADIMDASGYGRTAAVGFSIGNKGYIGTGAAYYTGYDWGGNSYSYTVSSNNFWEYDPVTDAWAQKANFGGSARQNAVGFSIGSKGYIGTGLDPSLKNDFWEYDPTTNVWTQKANFGGSARYAAVGFSIGSKGYIGTGRDGAYKNDFWEYDPATNTWTQRANFGGTARAEAVGFSIGSKGYIGTGYDGAHKNDFWEYDPATNMWTQRANFGGTARS